MFVEDKIENYGYRVRTFDGFMSGAVDFHGFDGSHMTADEKRRRYDAIREKLRERAAGYDGTHVAYDPNGDEDGWLIVGSETMVREETERMIAEGML